MTLPQLHKVFQKWLDMKNMDPVDVTVATILANRFNSTPVWLFLVGPSGCAKSEILLSTHGTGYIADIGNMTPSSLISGKGTSAGVLFDEDRVGGSGKPPYIFTMKDFTTIWGKHDKDQENIMGQLRQVYDGEYTYVYGNGQRSSITWKGQVGVIAAVTPEIERKRTVYTALGERFIHYQFPPGDLRRIQMALKAANNASTKRKRQGELKEAMMKYLAQFGTRSEILKPPTFPKKFVEEVAWMSEFVAHGRAGVYRENYTQEIDYEPTPEVPTRLTEVFILLAQGIAMARGKRAVTREDLELLAVIAKSSISQRRRKIIEFFVANDIAWNGFATLDISEKLHLPANTVLRRMEDMWVLDCFERNKGEFPRNGHKPEASPESLSPVGSFLDVHSRGKTPWHWRFSKKFVEILKKSRSYEVPQRVLQRTT